MMSLKELVLPIVQAFSSEEFSLIIKDSAAEFYSWEDINILFPIVKHYSSENYALIIVDSAGTTHYWHEDGTYDGFHVDGGVDVNTKTNLN
tara:strand:+ start:1518 stop:1790 length:273 start_codon:yes stop_codon:yes gene_type:complete